MPLTTLPNPGMDFTPLTPLTAEEMDDIVENIEAINNATIQTGSIADGAITKAKLGADALTNLNYSTSETDTGTTWVDGSRIFKKTIIMTSATWTSSTQEVKQAHGITNVAKWVKIEAVSDDGYWAQPLPNVFFSSQGYQSQAATNYMHTQLLVSGTDIMVRASDPTLYDHYVTLYYTKTS